MKKKHEADKKLWLEYREQEIQKAFDEFFTRIEKHFGIKNAKHPKTKIDG